MRRSQLAAVTMTWARSGAEEEILRQSVPLLAARGLRVAIADRGVSPGFRAFLGSLPGVRIVASPAHTLVAQVKAAVELASQWSAPFLLYTEPDKAIFFAHHLDGFIRAAPDTPDIGIVLAARSEGAFSTFPPTQRHTEGAINQQCGELIGRRGDYTFGPFLMSRSLLPALADMDDELGWGWRLSLFVTAARRDLRVMHVTGAYECPSAERMEGDAEREHRLRQLEQNMAGLTS